MLDPDVRPHATKKAGWRWLPAAAAVTALEQVADKHAGHRSCAAGLDGSDAAPALRQHHDHNELQLP